MGAEQAVRLPTAPDKKVLQVALSHERFQLSTSPEVRLDPHGHLFTLTVHDVNAFLSSASQDNDIKAQIRRHIPRK